MDSPQKSPFVPLDYIKFDYAKYESKLIQMLYDSYDGVGLKDQASSFIKTTPSYKVQHKSPITHIWTKSPDFPKQEPLYLIDSKGRVAYYDGERVYMEWKPGFYLCFDWNHVQVIRRDHGKVQYWSTHNSPSYHWAMCPDKPNPKELLEKAVDMTYVDDAIEYVHDLHDYSNVESDQWRVGVCAPSYLVDDVRRFVGLSKRFVNRAFKRRKERAAKKRKRGKFRY